MPHAAVPKSISESSAHADMIKSLGMCEPRWRALWRRHAGLSPLKVVREVQQLCAELHVVVGEDELSSEARRNATLLFHALLRSTLAAKRVLSEHRLSEDAFDYLVGEIRTRFHEVRPVRLH